MLGLVVEIPTDTYGSPNLQVTTFWSKAGVLGIALEWPQNDCEVAFVDYLQAQTFLSLESSDCAFLL